MRQTKNIPLVIVKAISCILFVSGSFNPAITNATEYFVAINGNDAQPGTKSAPVRTIQKGISLMRSGYGNEKGDTLYLREGTYGETINSNNLTIPTGTSWANAPVIAAYHGERVILRPNGAWTIINVADPGIHYVIFERLILDGTDLNRENGVGISVGNGTNHVRFLNMEVKDCPALSVLLSLRPSEKQSGISEGGVFNEFIGGKYHGAGKNRGDILSKNHGSTMRSYNFYITSDNNLFDGLEVYDATHYGYHIYNAVDPRPSHNIVRNNRIYHNSIENPSTSGILLASGKGNMAYNNLVYNSPGHGLQVGNGSIDAKVYNNTIYNNKYSGIGIGKGTGGATNTIVTNNISYKNGANYEDIGISTKESTNMMDGTDPLFIDPSNLDFHPQSNNPKSSAIDNGVTLAEVTMDFDGNARTQEAPYDIGAFEFNPSTVGLPRNFRILTVH